MIIINILLLFNNVHVYPLTYVPDFGGVMNACLSTLVLYNCYDVSTRMLLIRLYYIIIIVSHPISIIWM